MCVAARMRSSSQRNHEDSAIFLDRDSHTNKPTRSDEISASCACRARDSRSDCQKTEAKTEAVLNGQTGGQSAHQRRSGSRLTVTFTPPSHFAPPKASTTIPRDSPPRVAPEDDNGLASGERSRGSLCASAS